MKTAEYKIWSLWAIGPQGSADTELCNITNQLLKLILLFPGWLFHTEAHLIVHHKPFQRDSILC